MTPWYRDRPGPEPERPDMRHRYACTICRKELKAEYVVRIERGYLYSGPCLRIIHRCPCTDGILRATRYPYVEGAIARLIGWPFSLPWPSPDIEDEGEALDNEVPPPEPPPSREERIDRQVARWKWDLDHTDSVRDFLLQCRGPRDDI